jgi:hypothetical protein
METNPGLYQRVHFEPPYYFCSLKQWHINDLATGAVRIRLVRENSVTATKVTTGTGTYVHKALLQHSFQYNKQLAGLLKLLIATC